MPNTALHRALLSRRFPQLPITDGQPTVSGNIPGNVMIAWTIALIVGTGRWRLDLQTGSSKQRIEAQRLDEVVEHLSFEEARLEHDAETASLNERRRQANDAFAQWLAAIPTLSDADLDHETRSAENHVDHCGDLVDRWGWDTTMTGPNDPGITHYRSMLDQATRSLDALKAEKTRRRPH